MWRFMVAGITVFLVGCSTRAQLDPPTPRSEDCTPLGAAPRNQEQPPLWFIDGRAASRDDLTGTCKENIDRIEVLKGDAASRYILSGDTGNGVVLVYTKG